VELLDTLENPVMKGSYTGINFRALTYMVKILYGDDKKGRRKFSFVEFVWLKIVEQFRSFYMDFEAINKFKANLFMSVEIKGLETSQEQATKYIAGLKLSKQEKEKLHQFLTTPAKHSDGTYTILHFLIVDVLTSRYPATFAVFADGTYLLNDSHRLHLYSDTEKARLNQEAYITVSLMAILRSFLASEFASDVLAEIDLLPHAESQLFRILEKGNYDTIYIITKYPKPSTVQLEKGSDVNIRIVDALFKNEFHQIVVEHGNRIILKVDHVAKLHL